MKNMHNVCGCDALSVVDVDDAVSKSARQRNIAPSLMAPRGAERLSLGKPLITGLQARDGSAVWLTDTTRKAMQTGWQGALGP